MHVTFFTHFKMTKTASNSVQSEVLHSHMQTYRTMTNHDQAEQTDKTHKKQMYNNDFMMTDRSIYCEERLSVWGMGEDS